MSAVEQDHPRRTLADVPPPDALACRRLLALLKASPSTESELAGDHDDAA